MISVRDIVIFFAGVEFWHTFTHIVFAFFVSLPLDMNFIVMTPKMNMWGIIVNATITIILIYLALRLSRNAKRTK